MVGISSDSLTLSQQHLAQDEERGGGFPEMFSGAMVDG